MGGLLACFIPTARLSEKSLCCSKCKLYRYENNSGEWKERGAGQVKLLESNENKRIRLLHRQEKTLKIRANHICKSLVLLLLQWLSLERSRLLMRFILEAFQLYSLIKISMHESLLDIKIE